MSIAVWSRTVVVSLSIGALGCGGLAEEDTAPGPGAGTADGGTTTGSGSGGGKLGECKPGFAPNTTGEPCNWVVEGLCYVDRPDACACACPTDVTSTCSSGFGGFDAREPVRCFPD